MTNQDQHLPGQDSPENKNGSIQQGKGKDKEPGLAERLQASGKLAFNTITNIQPLPNLAVADKVTGSSSGSSSSNTHRTDAIESQKVRLSHQGNTVGSFRGGIPQSAETGRTFDDFQQQHQPWSAGTSALSIETAPQAQAKQEASDGFAVVDLLSQPDVGVEAHVVAEQDQQLGPEEAASLRNALFGSQHEASAWNGLLDFSPEFIARPNAATADLQQHLGIKDATTARQLWAQQWADALSSYTDEVWGDLGPLVSDAKQEIEKLTQPMPEADLIKSGTVAVDRLRQILAHVRGHV
jgi:hypothetical protein